MRIVTSEFEIKKKFRIQIQEFGSESQKLNNSKNIMIYDDLGILEIEEFYSFIGKQLKEFINEKERQVSGTKIKTKTK